MSSTSTAPSPADAKVCDCVCSAVVDAVERLCGAAPARLTSAPANGNEEEVIGIISFVGPTSWSLSWGFGEKTAVALTKALMGMEIEFSSSEMGEVTSELANILAGDVVAHAYRMGMQVQMSLPTVARGRSVEFGGSTHRIHFNSAAGPFWVCICVRSQMSDVKMPGIRPDRASSVA